MVPSSIINPPSGGEKSAATDPRLQVGIFHPADPMGHIPGGIDTIIRGVLKWAPPDLNYTLFGATSDPVRRPVGQEVEIRLADNRAGRYVPLVDAHPSAMRGAVPLIVRYLLALRRYLRAGRLAHLDILDFHRIEALALLKGDTRPKNVMIHQDMEVIRNKDADIAWRHAPWLYELMERWLFRDVDRIFCVRQTGVKRYQQTYPKIANKFSFLPTWVDVTVFHPLTGPGERSSKRARVCARLEIPVLSEILISVGRLDRQKDPMLLLDAMRLVADTNPNAHLLLIGDGILRPQIEERLQLSPLKGRVSLLGAIPPPEIAELLQVSDAFVLASAYEGMPIVVLEALATGVPVVTTDVGEVRLVVHDGVDGFVVGDREVPSLAECIAEALRLKETLRGSPCLQAIADYVPERVLANVYDNHRREGQRA